MSDDHHRTGKVPNQALEPQDAVQVEMIGGLVEQQQIGVGHQRPRQRDTLHPPAGEAADLRLTWQPKAQHHLLYTLIETPRVGAFDLVLQ